MNQQFRQETAVVLDRNLDFAPLAIHFLGHAGQTRAVDNASVAVVEDQSRVLKSHILDQQPQHCREEFVNFQGRGDRHADLVQSGQFPDLLRDGLDMR